MVRGEGGGGEIDTVGNGKETAVKLKGKDVGEEDW